MRMDMQARPHQSSGSGKRDSTPDGRANSGEKKPTREGPLSVPLSQTKDQAAFKYLFQETSLESIRTCLAEIRDQEIVEFLQEGILKIAGLMSCEAFTGLERTRRELRALKPKVAEDAKTTRRSYDRHVENLGQLIFALGRRLDQFQEFLAKCPFSGSAELTRGLYGQKVRDLAGDVLFLKVELFRWVRRFVPLRGELPEGVEGQSFLEGRISAVVDDLGLRLKETQEILTSAIYSQLVVFDESLTRSKLFKHDIENFMNIDHLLSWLTELTSRVKEYDEQRRPEQLQRVKTLLQDFSPEQFPALSGIRESDHAMFIKLIPQVLAYRHRDKEKGDDPIHIFLLLIEDLVHHMKLAGVDASPFDPDLGQSSRIP